MAGKVGFSAGEVTRLIGGMVAKDVGIHSGHMASPRFPTPRKRKIELHRRVHQRKDRALARRVRWMTPSRLVGWRLAGWLRQVVQIPANPGPEGNRLATHNGARDKDG